MSSGSESWPTTTDILAIPLSTQPQAAAAQPQTDLEIAPGSFIAAIVGAILGTALVVGALIYFYCVRPRRATPTGPILIDDDALSKVESEAPAHAYMSPFPTPPAASRPRLSPLRVTRLQLVPERPSSGHRHSPTQRPPPSYRKSSTYYSTSSTSTRSPTVGYQPVSQRNDKSAATSPMSTRSPAASYKLASYQRVSHHRKMSYDLPQSSPLSKPSFFDERPAARRASTLPLSGVQRLESQVDLETAFSETVYDKEEEPEIPTKPPTRRRPLRCTSEPRPLSSEFGSTEGHELERMIQQRQPDDLHLGSRILLLYCCSVAHSVGV
ncbi:hypothetical protein B0H19DRAFT_1122326, partial [Mycena capillaripes]